MGMIKKQQLSISFWVEQMTPPWFHAPEVLAARMIVVLCGSLSSSKTTRKAFPELLEVVTSHAQSSPNSSKRRAQPRRPQDVPGEPADSLRSTTSIQLRRSQTWSSACLFNSVLPL